ncbi:MAG: cobalamin biosynthesis protein [Anaerolineaceae bacterium]|nr:cobalamin biosynthesis protein [Anaerolineaceae bacterium]
MNPFQEKVIIILLAILVDVLIGDPPNRFHPVAWIGSLIAWLKSHAPHKQSTWIKFSYGGLIAVAGFLLMGSIGLGLRWLLTFLPTPLDWLLSALILKTLFAFRMLLTVGKEIHAALLQGNLIEARRLVSWHLVSRDTRELSTSQTTAAAIESLAENTSDSIIAPLFYFLILGFPGVLIYRFANTADAMLGYRDEAHEWLGKLPARMDDFLNLIPARITAFLFLISTPFIGGNVGKAIRIWWQDRYNTSSPNAGHPMSAAAGVLGIELNKVEYYTLGKNNKEPTDEDLLKMIKLTQSTVILFGTFLIIGFFLF